MAPNKAVVCPDYGHIHMHPEDYDAWSGRWFGGPPFFNDAPGVRDSDQPKGRMRLHLTSALRRTLGVAISEDLPVPLLYDEAAP